MIEVLRTDAHIPMKGDSYAGEHNVLCKFIGSQGISSFAIQDMQKVQQKRQRLKAAAEALFTSTQEEEHMLLENVARLPWSSRDEIKPETRELG